MQNCEAFQTTIYCLKSATFAAVQYVCRARNKSIEHASKQPTTPVMKVVVTNNVNLLSVWESPAEVNAWI
jgi:hypothetical protein